MTAAPDPIRIVGNLLALAVQLLIADNPDVLLPPEVVILRPSPRLARARAVIALLRETHYALDVYAEDNAPSAATPPETPRADLSADFPF